MEQSGKFSLDRWLVGEGGKLLFLYLFGAGLCLYGLLSEPLPRIFEGILQIVVEPDYLLTDYFHTGGIGAAFVNSGFLTLLFTSILVYYGVHIRGISIAAIFTVAGFALFGKNILNVWFILIGVWLFALYQKDSFLKYIYVAFFGTALAPMVSQLMFGLHLTFPLRILAGALSGIAAGFILPALAAAMLSVHRGYNLYNVGFTAGMTGLLFVSLFRSHGFLTEPRIVWTTGNNGLLLPLLLGLCIAMIFAGFCLNKCSFKGLYSMWDHPGRLLSDFVDIFDFPLVLANMGSSGLLSIGYLLLIGGDLNGPTIAGLFTIIGFSAMGKTPRSILPIFMGVALASLTKQWSLSDPALQLAALFGTTLAPIAGEFGWKAGVVAGYLHSSIVLYVGVLHAGFNLYNNGFAGGFAATLLVPLIETFKGRKKE